MFDLMNEIKEYFKKINNYYYCIRNLIIKLYG